MKAHLLSQLVQKLVPTFPMLFYQLKSPAYLRHGLFDRLCMFRLLTFFYVPFLKLELPRGLVGLLGGYIG